MKARIPAFSGYGIELEYMIVDRDTLSIKPIADKLLHQLAGTDTDEIQCGKLAWSNELALHLLELKNSYPESTLASLHSYFQNEINRVNAELGVMNARLMPTAMHPWMNPRIEAQLWPHAHAEIYQTYDRIFDCKRHGWGNLQSMHLNLPFSDNLEFVRLHSAIRLLLPILPALAASSPILEAQFTGFLDRRMEQYLTHQINIPTTMGKVIPDSILSESDYQTQVLNPMYQEIAPLDPDGILQHEWLNVRAAVPRFVRSAIEIRIIDVQECPYADLAIAAVVSGVVKAIYQQKTASLVDQQAIHTDSIVTILRHCIQDAEQATIADPEYLRLLGFAANRCTAGQLWQHLIESLIETKIIDPWRKALKIILEQGSLASRIIQALNQDFSRQHLQLIYHELCNCLETGQMFQGMNH